ncbi:hypothetical protein BC939DRAFT_463355 [Gamsiella multidivaricata]|uniref:uncharacterized protein n=1 Tax=Gamsiella multidivaricata TaxID=101098 RepID=UPI002220E849|nr:uncharacterized protein BC939DRAFT_463355 [Gamsiella multidivaricata]KAG0360165.1 hypothetical protein BGZ54_009662 [Gamsiella multidivaricata]KAI7818346.1 hypothetical protein BC939DRAFT_463355 [Gamsiella multidivaricata]
MMFEKLLAELECTAAVFVRRIWSGEDISLTRTELADFKKFLAIMMYRGEHRRKQYFEDRFDFATRMTIKKHMRENNISKIQDVWFENLKWIIKTPIEDILKEFERAHGPMDPFAIMVAYRGPIHAVELLDFGYMVMNTVCIWHAEEGSEFILSNTSFGSFEGDMGVNFHSFFVVSPEYAVVLISRLYMNGQMEMLPLRKSWFGKELRAFPDAVYMNENPKSQDDFTKDDVFKYRRIVVPKQKVYLVNSILLDSRDKYITYKSSPSMYKSLLYYDKHKGELFHNQYDYSILKRKVFAEMNRTHSA